MSNYTDYDVIIVGGGPAGASCALSLKNSPLQVAIVDKAFFPRDKVCGDALSVDVLNQLPLLSPEVAEAFDVHPAKVPSSGVRLFSPDMTGIDIPFFYKGAQKSGYTMRRSDFDNILMDHVKKSGVVVREGCGVDRIVRGSEGLTLQTDQGEFSAKMIVGADGANSIVRRFMDNRPINRRQHSAGLRVYYEGVGSFHDENYIELYFFKDILPGYLWIFPLSDGKANVGIGMLSSVVSGKKVNLKETLDRFLKDHPKLKDRFANARALETVKGHGLPLGSGKRQLSSDNILLTGDAAGLIDPFSGEGIGNAIRSGRIAAEHIENCFQQQNFAATFNTQYDAMVYRKMDKEFRISRSIQRLSCYPGLFSFVIRKASQSTYWQNFLVKAMADVDYKKHFLRPSFYYRLITN